MCAWGAQARTVFLASHLPPHITGAEILVCTKGLHEICLM